MTLAVVKCSATSVPSMVSAVASYFVTPDRGSYRLGRKQRELPNSWQPLLRTISMRISHGVIWLHGKGPCCCVHLKGSSGGLTAWAT